LSKESIQIIHQLKLTKSPEHVFGGKTVSGFEVMFGGGGGGGGFEP